MRNLLAAAGALATLAVGHAAHAAPPPCAAVSEIKFSTPPQFETSNQRFKSDGLWLEGCLYQPKGKARFPVLVAVSGSDDVPTAADIYTVIHAKAFAAKGVGLFAINKRGFGNSEGQVTDTDFAQRAADVAAAVRHARTLLSADRIGLWGSSQGSWVIPQALRPQDGVEAVILTSPSGVNPYDQIAFYIRNVALGLGMSAEDAAKAEDLHRVVFRYYATGKGYRAAQALARRRAAEPWFEAFRANQDWDVKIAPGGALLTPAELRTAWVKRADDFAIYRAASTFADTRPIYARLDRTTLMVEGGADTNVPVAQSEAAIRAGLRPAARDKVTFKLFDGAEHGIQDGPRVRAAYLDFISDWAAKKLGAD